MKWLFLQTENSTRRLKDDLAGMTAHFSGEERGEIETSLRLLNVSEMDFATICMSDGHPDRTRILATLEAWPADVVVVDPLRDAGRGDPNKDGDMIETCQGIAAVVRCSNPRRATLVIHHGRTGASEASKVFGDDAASFGRNSKVLNGWLRSQINVAPAGVDSPNVVIVGCGKNSNGPKWEPFAARFEPESMTYRRLRASEFDLDAWAARMAGGKRSKAALPTPEQVAEVVQKAGGEVEGGVNSPAGLIGLIRKKFKVSRPDAQQAVSEAIGVTIVETNGEKRGHRGGGKPMTKYVLHSN